VKADVNETSRYSSRLAQWIWTNRKDRYEKDNASGLPARDQTIHHKDDGEWVRTTCKTKSQAKANTESAAVRLGPRKGVSSRGGTVEPSIGKAGGSLLKGTPAEFQRTTG
jgi:hypothetical protein